MKIVHLVEKKREGTYYTVEFDVPENVVSVTVKYDYLRETKGFLGDLVPTNTIDIGLMDESGKFLGWSGSSRSEITVGQFGSTSGYLSQPINSGKWKIIIGAYHVVPQGVEVEYDISFEFKSEKLLFGDLHIHTTASDGFYDACEIGKKAKELGLDFIGLANHNNFSENLNLPHIDGLTFIPAVEWTHYKGHMNFFGVKEPFENSFIANSEDEMKEIVAHARSLGAVISVNHPKCSICPYLWENEDFDMLEVWNGPMRPTNIRGHKYWTELLRQGRKIPIVGGSDYHKPHMPVKLGNPVTGVYSPSMSSDDIIDSLKKGHAFVTSGTGGVKLNLRSGKAMMGDTVTLNTADGIDIEAENLKGESLILVTDSGETLIKKCVFGSYKKNVTLTNGKFAYVKAIKNVLGNEMFAAVTNPIYFKEKI